MTTKKKIILPVSADIPVEITRAMPVAPTTTEQEDMVTAGQRRVNLIWEVTQAIIAIAVTFSLIYTSIIQIPAEELRNAFFLIVGFYFARTNHQAIGGVGVKVNQSQPYQGR